MPRTTLRWSRAIVVICVLAGGAVGAGGQAAPATPGAAAAAAARPFKPEELEQLVSPVALYPDALLAQVLMASTYPLEIVQAERWAAANKSVKGDALAAELNKQNWDPSVKSLVDFPQVLEMMSKQLEWTTKLGDAFIADQKAVMNAVQKLRAKAQAAGNLKDSDEQKIVIEQAPAQTVVVQGEPPPPQIIKIESPSPQVVYVPTYNPAVVYGAWPYPAYPPPPPYYPPGYVASNLVSFGAGVALGAAWGHAWGDCDWGHGDVDIDVNRNAEFNQNINRESYRAQIENRSINRQGDRNTFQHDPSHRKGVAYRDEAAARKVGQLPASTDAARARESFRGRAETGRQDIARGGADQFRGTGGVERGGGLGPSARPGVGAGDSGRGGAFANRASATPSRSLSTSQYGGSAFSGAERGGAAARADSSRGQLSRSSPSPSRSSFQGGGGGGFRSSGASRGGGARGGGGRGGGRR